MRFTAEDGSEWEPYTGSAGISGIKLDGKEGIVLKRIQPKEKSLYEKVCEDADMGEAYSKEGLAYWPIHKFMCQHIEALEKRVEELEK